MNPDASTLDLLGRVYANANSYIDTDGSFRHRVPDTFTEADLRALKNAGLEPNCFIEVPHDEAVHRLRHAAARTDLKRAADAFVASMVSSDLAWLPVLPAMALGLAMPAHAADNMGKGTCRVCFYQKKSVDATLRAYFRHQQGTGWESNYGPLDGMLTLETALQTPLGDWPVPTPRDIWVFHKVLDLLRELPAQTRYSKARNTIKDAKLLRVNNPYRCETMLEALGTMGVLQTPDHPGLFTRWTTEVERDQRPSTKVEVPGPLGWWSAADGVNEALLQRLFGHLKRPGKEPAAPAAAKPVRRTAVLPTGGAKTIPGPPAAGDVYALRLREDLWGAAYCHEVATDGRGIVRGRLEYLDLLSPTPPAVEQLEQISGFRDRKNGKRWQFWGAGLGKTTGVKRIAVEVPAPAHDQPTPERIESGQAKDLLHLAHWNFPMK